jgi:hypothetical protein
MTLMLALFTAQFSWAAKSQIFIYQSPQTKFQIKLEKNHLILQSPRENVALPIKPCNQRQVNELWQKVEGLAKKLPADHGKKAPEYVELNGERKLLISPNTKPLRQLDHSVIELAALDKKLCG